MERKQKKLTSIFALIFASGISFNALAGTQIVMINSEVGQSKTTESTMYVDNGKIRMDANDLDENEETQMIFDNQSQKMTMINVTQKNYMVMDANTLKMFKARMEAMKKQMEAQMANMSPEQRKMMEGMMAGKMGMGEKKPKPAKEIVKTGRTGSAGGFDCDVVEVKSEGKKIREFCVTAWSDFKNGKEVKVAMTGMMAFFGKLMDSMAGMMPEDEDQPFAELEQLGGFPVVYKHFENGQLKETSTLKSVSSKAIDATLFKAPEGYAQQQMMEGM